MVSFAADAAEFAGPDSPVPALAAALCDQGHEVVLLTRGQQAKSARWLADTTFEVRDLTADPVGAMTEQAALAHVGQFVRELAGVGGGGFDVLHSHGWLAGLAAHLAAPAAQVPLVHTFHRLWLMEALPESGDRDGPVPASWVRAERAVARGAGHLIASSILEREALIRIGVARRCITVVPPGTAQANITPEPGHERERHQLWRVVVFGPPSRATDVVYALTGLPTTELVMCRTPDDPAAEADDGLTELATRLGVAQRVRTEYLATPSERAPLIRTADVVFCVSHSARAGTGHLEAMALGVPVVAAGPRAAEAVVDGITGLHALNATPRSLGALLGGLLANQTLRQAMSAAARDRADSRYSWPRIAAETTRVYHQLLSPPDDVKPRRAAVPKPRTGSLPGG